MLKISRYLTRDGWPVPNAKSWDWEGESEIVRRSITVDVHSIKKGYTPLNMFQVIECLDRIQIGKKSER